MSSLYLLYEAEYFSNIQKMEFGFGLLLGNMLPSFLLNDEFNIRKYIFEAQNIPGGGWLPIFIFVSFGYVGVGILSFLIVKLYTSVSQKILSMIIYNDYRLLYISFIITFVSTAPNWFMYTPYQVLKMPIYSCIMTYFLVGILNVALSKKINR